eukprot:CAMPEP_0205893562 /NCGR_PEP_ID=MMETSP1083-20121108/23331_1 /ASSEMBLY_ACC=CAM_ASM_000430 /TAXON_ID=97485 /ORGANISM="Prymnesium parvum, Strain Texoma1" /LENGTH=140 /DNA_ID=CAMNT_0053258265 /DNA_START=1791 /DNA_END=2213 /DNA_ORIENTATION=+
MESWIARALSSASLLERCASSAAARARRASDSSLSARARTRRYSSSISAFALASCFVCDDLKSLIFSRIPRCARRVSLWKKFIKRVRWPGAGAVKSHFLQLTAVLREANSGETIGEVKMTRWWHFIEHKRRIVSVGHMPL